MDQTKKVWKFLSSMKLALILLGILIVACSVGSFVTQGQTYEWYEQVYSKTAAGLIMALGMDDIFHVWWFVLITLFLCMNLLMCNIVRMPSLLKRMKSEFAPEHMVKKAAAPLASFEKNGSDKADALFAKLGFSKKEEYRDEEGNRYRCSSKNKIGIWGAWVTHLGILILIIGFGFGQSMKTEYTVYGVPGQSKQIGETDYILSINDFNVALREDDTVEQYTAALTVRNADKGSQKDMTVSVNNPASAYGMKFYQNAMGWAATLHVVKDGEERQTEILCQSEYAEITDVPGLIILLKGFYPDYVQGEDGMPATASAQVNNPGYLYQAFYNGEMQQMNVLYGDSDTNEIRVNEEYTIYFDSPQYYTLIQVKRDPFTGIALIGGLIVMIGLLLSFYVQPREMWARINENGSADVFAYSRKGGSLYEESVREAAGEIKGKK